MNPIIPRDNSSLKVLVTGASGYLASHVVHQLLEKGYKVRGTVRSLTDTKKINHLYTIHPSAQQNLELVEADLLNPSSWDSAMTGIDYVMHVASPFPSGVVKDENQLIKPAVEGTTTVFEAAIKHKVKKIVITSSVAAVFTGQPQNTFNEECWSNPNNSGAYEKSKHLAEKKAWEIYEQNKDKIQMTIILPGFIQGPSFQSNDYTSADLVKRVLNNDFPALIKVSFGVVDVRDVAFAHVASIDADKLAISNGKRYILNEGTYWVPDIISILKEEFSQYGYKFPCMTLNSSFLFSCVALFDKQAKLLKPMFGRFICFDNNKSRQELGVQYRYHRTTILEFAYDLIKKGQVPNKLPKQMKLEYVPK